MSSEAMSSDESPDIMRVLPVKHTYSRIGKQKKIPMKTKNLSSFRIPMNSENMSVEFPHFDSIEMNAENLSSDSLQLFGLDEIVSEKTSYETPPLFGLIQRTPSVRKPYDRVGETRERSRKTKMLPRIKIPFSNLNDFNTVQTGIKGKVATTDDEGHLNFNIGDNILSYDLLGFLGKGTFGRVVKARNLDTAELVALKIVRNTEGCRENAKNEVSVLSTLKQIDPEGKNLWVRLLDYFEYQGHICLAFEKLGDSLYSFMKENRHRGYQLSDIRHLAHQICRSVKALHESMIIHTDLKPENICLVASNYTYGNRSIRQHTYRKPLSTNIRVIDFGSAIDFFEDRNIMIQTRYYRAPEVIFGRKWNQAVDIWSIGCILFELCTGECLFIAHDDDEHCHILMDVLGPLPDIYRLTALGQKHVNCKERRKRSRKPLKKCVKMLTTGHEELFDLIEKLLAYNPEERLSLTAALNHPFFLPLSDNQKFKH